MGSQSGSRGTTHGYGTYLGGEYDVPIFSKFLQLAWSVYHRAPHELTMGFEGLSCGVIGFPVAHGVFWLLSRDLLFLVIQLLVPMSLVG